MMEGLVAAIFGLSIIVTISSVAIHNLLVEIRDELLCHHERMEDAP